MGGKRPGMLAGGAIGHTVGAAAHAGLKEESGFNSKDSRLG